MSGRRGWTRRATRLIVIAVLVLVAPARIGAQRGGGAPAAPPPPRAEAAIDLTGTWVSVISEDWALRMVTPRKGDYTRVPLTPAARALADAWDPAADEAAGESCNAYGAPGDHTAAGPASHQLAGRHDDADGAGGRKPDAALPL